MKSFPITTLLTAPQEPALAPLLLREQEAAGSSITLLRAEVLNPIPSIPKSLPRGPGPVAYLERVQVGESMQEGRPGGARQLMAKRAGEMGYVAGGQHQHIQLGELGVRWHGRQSSLQGQEGLAQRPHPAPLPCCILRTGLTLHRGPPVSGSDQIPTAPASKNILV